MIIDIILAIIALPPTLLLEFRFRELLQRKREHQCTYHLKREKNCDIFIMVCSLIPTISYMTERKWIFALIWAVISYIVFCIYTRDKAELTRRNNGHYVDPDCRKNNV